MRISVIGAGSTYTPDLIAGFIRNSKDIEIDEFILMDIDEARLEILGNFTQRMFAEAGINWDIVLSSSMLEALTDVDFVITQFRVGGQEARRTDELVPREFNLIGQETVGVGGFASAQRNIPVILKICEAMQRLSPRAWLLNSTNPVSIITEAANVYGKVNTVGFCNIPYKMVNAIANTLEISSSMLSVDYIGLNHFGWILKVFKDNTDITNLAISKTCEIAQSVHRIPNVDFEDDLLLGLGYIPSPYIRYFYHPEKMRLAESVGKCRAEQVMEVEKELLTIYSDPSRIDRPTQMKKRGGVHESELIADFICSMVNNKNKVMIVNTQNKGCIEGLRESAIVEITSFINARGVFPIKTDTYHHIPPEILAWIQLMKHYEELVVSAAVNKSIREALMALTIHPLVPDYETSKVVFNRIMDKNKEYLEDFGEWK